ncbi:hypothetical protein CAEBREN_30243, partial [Caenorhabditis brenneri]
MTVFGEDCQSMRCTDFTNPAIRKQVITFQGFKYCYYFTTHAECIIHRPEDAPGYAEIKRADKKVLAELKAEILPFRSVGAALQICREKGHALTRKQILNAKLQRCDVHILSILKHNHGGKAAADDAQPYIFGRMKEGKWCSGILGCFTIEKFEERLKKCRGKIHPKIYHWLNSNKTMLMESASAFAKLKCGHILQYSTNNQNENFNAQLKAVINKRQDAHLLQQQLVTFCKAKLKELYLSTIDGSDYVLFTQDIVSKSSDEKYDALNRLGLQGSLVFAFGIPLPVAERLDIDLQVAEEQKTVYLQIIDTSSSGFCVKESGAKPAYANVTWKNDTFECELCGDTLPAFLCRH